MFLIVVGEEVLNSKLPSSIDSLLPGVAVPIPTLPDVSIDNLRAPSSCIENLLPSLTKSILPIVLVPLDILIIVSTKLLLTWSGTPGLVVPIPTLPLLYTKSGATAGSPES